MKPRPLLVTIVLAVLLVWPLLPSVPYDLISTAILASSYLIVALSLVLLIGLVGQISLCQAALVGMGAFVSAIATTRFGLHFPFTLLVGLTAGAVTAAVIGVVALRVRGLYLAVATLIFAYICDKYLFSQAWLVQSQSGTSIPPEVVGRPGTLPFFDLADAHVFYYVALAVAALSLYSLANLRESRVGRAFAAIRGSEVAAASLGVDVVRFKLAGFATAGALAGLAGSLIMTGQRTVAPDQFKFTASLYFLAIAVVAGLRSLGGAIASALVFAVLVGEIFFRFPALADYLDVVTAVLLLSVLLFFRGGLGAVPARLRVIWARFEPRVMPVVVRIQSETAPYLAWVRAPLTRRQKERKERRPWEDGDGPATAKAKAAKRAMADTSGEFGNLAPVTHGGVDAFHLSPVKRVGALLGMGRPAPVESGEAIIASSPVDVLAVVDRLLPRRAARVEVPGRASERSGSGPWPDDGRGGGVGAMLKTAEAGGEVAGESGDAGRRSPVLLSAERITVRFGGLTAVANVSIQVCAGEIVGLIGPNGAGKTTLFNSLLGLNSPTDGRVHLYGQEVTEWPVHRRAALGVGRTFQVLQLFSDLTVYDNLLVATHLHNGTGVFGSIFVSPKVRLRERAARARVEAVLRLMDLEQFADRQVEGLPFGVLRLIEVARTLVTGARLVCFDEPASGLDSAETERLIEWFRVLKQIGITLLVIEHDVSMVLRLCDYVYVLDQGKLISHGTPAAVQRDPQVVASYLGTEVEESA